MIYILHDLLAYTDNLLGGYRFLLSITYVLDL